MTTLLALAWGLVMLARVGKSPMVMVKEFQEIGRLQQVNLGDLWNLWRLAAPLAVSLGWLTGILASAWAVGDILFSRDALPSDPAGTLVKIAVGLGSLILFLAGAGALQAFFPPFFFGLWALGVLLFLWRIRNRLAVCRQTARSVWDAVSGKEGHAIAWMSRGLVALLALELLLALVPEVIYDALMYHLTLPRLYLLHGGILSLPWDVYTQFPQGLEMLYTWCLGLCAADTLPKLLHAVLAWGTTIGAALLAARWENRRAGWAAALLFASTPVVFLNSTVAMIDFGVAFFGVTSFLVLERWLESGEGGRPALLWAGFLGGMALACKYTGIYSVFSLGLLVLYAEWKRSRRWQSAAQRGVLYGLCALIGIFPWLAKNLVLQGNPVSPFGTSFFGHSGLAAQDFARMRAEMPARLTEPTLWGWIRMPWVLSTEGADWHHWLGPAYLLLAGAVFLRGWKKEARWAWLYVGFYAIPWSLQSHVVRFFFPALAVMAALWGAGVDSALKRGRSWRFLWGTLLAGLVILNTQGALSYFLYQHEALPVLTGKETRAEYLSMPLAYLYPAPSYAVLAWANAHLQQKSSVLFIGETRGFFCERPFIAPSPWDPHPLTGWIQRSATPQELMDHLMGAHLTHFLVNDAEWVRVGMAQQWLSLSAAQWALFNQFWAAHVREIYHRGEASLLELEASPASPAATNLLWDDYWKYQTASWDTLDEAERERRFTQLGRDHPDSTVPWARLAELSLRRRRPDEALARLDRARGVSDEILFLRGVAFSQKGLWAQAEAILGPLTARRPDVPILAQQLALVRSNRVSPQAKTPPSD